MTTVPSIIGLCVEGSAALARIGGVIRPLVDALGSGDFQ